MPIKSIIQTSEDFAKTILGLCPDKMTARPFNRHEPAQTIWWLVPTTEWPAFKFGKYFFDNRPSKLPAGEKGFYCGYYVEKGVIGLAAELSRSYYRMDNDWKWNSFYNNMASNLQGLPSGFLVTIAVAYNPLADKVARKSGYENYLREKEVFSYSSVAYEILSDNKLKLRHINLSPNDVETANHFSASGKSVNNIQRLAKFIATLPKLDWLWIDLYIGKVVDVSSPAFSPVKVYDDIFKPLKKYLH